jgi:hypothetical protein
MCFTDIARYLNAKLEERVFALFRGEDFGGKITKVTLVSMEFSGNGFELFSTRLAK